MVLLFFIKVILIFQHFLLPRFFSYAQSFENKTYFQIYLVLIVIKTMIQNVNKKTNNLLTLIIIYKFKNKNLLDSLINYCIINLKVLEVKSLLGELITKG